MILAMAAVALQLLHPALPEMIDEVLKLRGWSWAALESGIKLPTGDILTPDSLGWFLVQADPVLWAESKLVNKPEDGGGLWSFFPYQRESLRYRGNTIHRCGAEVGKTREIVALAYWCASTSRGSCLVGSALDGDLDLIWEEMLWQKAANPYIKKLVTKTTTKPYRTLTFEGGSRVYLRPAGVDGGAFRGIHVRGIAFHDEASKVNNKICWDEFWRAGKPGCEFRLYSVPTGTETQYKRIADSAAPAPEAPSDPATTVLSILQPGHRAHDHFRLYWWPKWIMPPPFWDDDRRAEKIAQYGSEDDPGYVHNVAGLDGDPEYSVFPMRLLSPAIRRIPEYQSIRFLWSSLASRLDVDVWTTSPESVGDEETPAPPDLVHISQESVDISGWEHRSEEERTSIIRRVVRGVVAPLSGDLFVGVDPGSASIGEILIFRALGLDSTLIRRISLRGLDWIAIRDVVAELDCLMAGPQWGFDATGVGLALVHYCQPILLSRCSGFVFNVRAPDVDEILGEPLADPTSGRPVSLSYKELGTQLLERAFSQRRIGLPRDPEVMQLLTTHTYSLKGDHRRYSKIRDHVPDALRCMALARYLTTSGLVASAPITYAVPAGETRTPAFAELEGYLK